MLLSGLGDVSELVEMVACLTNGVQAYLSAKTWRSST
jgi:hypothetical protein